VDFLQHVKQFGPDNPAPHPVRKFLRESGGGFNVNLDYTVGGVGVTEYAYESPPGRITLISELILHILDATTPWSAVKYGAIALLAVGMKLELKRGAQVLHDLFDGATLKMNADIEAHCFNMRYIPWDGAVQSISGILKLSGSGGPLVLEPGDSLVLTASDDLDGLNLHTWKAIGVEYVDNTSYVQPPAWPSP